MVEIGLWYGKIEKDLRPPTMQVNLMVDGAIVTPPPPTPQNSSLNYRI